MVSHEVLNKKSTIYSSWLGETIISLTDPTFIIPDEYEYELFYVTEKYIARPDLISYDIYGEETYADVICKLNGISNPFEMNEGMVLKIPSPDCAFDFVIEPEPFELDFDVNTVVNNKPVAKPKSAKRKANEAILGDTRFKIDRTKGVVIY